MYQEKNLIDSMISFKELCENFLEERRKPVYECICNKCISCRWRQIREDRSEII